MLVSNDDYGDTLASVQGLLKKHEAFEADFEVHKQRSSEIEQQAQDLVNNVKLFNPYIIHCVHLKGQNHTVVYLTRTQCILLKRTRS